MHASILLLLLGLVPAVWCSCEFVPRVTFDQDPDDMSCEHPDYKGVTIDLGGHYLTPDCQNVTCEEAGFYSCSFGWGLYSDMVLPGDCNAEKDGECGVRFVREDGEKCNLLEDLGFA